MTTAARPTFDAARGGKGAVEGDLSAMTKQYSNRDLPSHTRLKYRQDGQTTTDEVRGRDFRHDLEERERVAREKRDRERGRGDSGHSKRARIEQVPVSNNLDADDPLDEDSSSDEDEDDTRELLAELQKIKKERATEQATMEAEKKQEEERIRTENILKGNPLLGDGDFSVKRRWDDDVVFKNCAKDEEDKRVKGFINDTLRSEFHKKFMEKYVK